MAPFVRLRVDNTYTLWQRWRPKQGRNGDGMTLYDRFFAGKRVIVTGGVTRQGRFFKPVEIFALSISGPSAASRRTRGRTTRAITGG